MTVDPGVVIAAISALATGIARLLWVIYRDLRQDRDFWRDTALAALGHTGDALEVAQVTKRRRA